MRQGFATEQDITPEDLFNMFFGGGGGGGTYQRRVSVMSLYADSQSSNSKDSEVVDSAVLGVSRKSYSKTWHCVDLILRQ